MFVSIIIPAYNAEKTIGYCLDSVLRQSYLSSDYEIIIVDDCSPDNQLNVIEKYLKNYDNIRLIKHSTNKKQGAARNTGLDEACGDWIIFLDSDDYWCDTDVLKTLYQLSTNYENLDVIESISHSDANGAGLSLCRSCKVISVLDQARIVNYYFQTTGMLEYVVRSIYKKEFLKSFRFRESVFFEDGDWKLKVALKTKKALIIDYPYYVYVNNPNSTIRKPNRQVFIDNVLCNVEIKNIVESSKDINLIKLGYQRLKRNVLSWIKIAFNYDLITVNTVFKIARDNHLLEIQNYRNLNLKEKILFWGIKRYPYTTTRVIKKLAEIRNQFIGVLKTK